MSGWRYAAVNDDGRVIGEDHHSAKICTKDIDLVLELRASGLSYRQIAAKFDDGDPTISKSMVHAICSGKRRAQTVMGHKRVKPRMPDYMPMDLDEFDFIGGF